MLSSIISTTSQMTTFALATSAMSAYIHIGETEVSVWVVLCLIVLLSASEVLSASKLWNKHLSLSLNIAILPLVVTFFAILAFRIIRDFRGF
jgi:hypothetical protein